MKEWQIVDMNDDILTAFGSFKILDDIDIIDHPAIYEFAKIVSNYIHMIKALSND